MVLTCSYRRICKACPSCSLVLLAIAFSIYIRVINRLLYQRRGLMFDVWSSIQFSRYGRRITGRRLSDVLHVISTQESLPGCSSHAKHVLYTLKKPARCSVLTDSRIAKRNSQIVLLALARMTFLFVSFCLSNVRPFLHASM